MASLQRLNQIFPLSMLIFDELPEGRTLYQAQTARIGLQVMVGDDQPGTIFQGWFFRPSKRYPVVDNT